MTFSKPISNCSKSITSSGDAVNAELTPFPLALHGRDWPTTQDIADAEMMGLYVDPAYYIEPVDSAPKCDCCGGKGYERKIQGIPPEYFTQIITCPRCSGTGEAEVFSTTNAIATDETMNEEWRGFIRHAAE